MEYFKLNNGKEIPAVGIGVFRIEDEQKAYNTVQIALEAGYRHIDTAMIYGNEKAVGKAVKDSGIPREQIFITTKLWNDDQRSGKVSEALDKSLERLGMDYVDLYLVHWPVKGTYLKVWKKMEEVNRSGKAKTIGVSNYQPHHLDELLKTAEIVPAVDQIETYPYFAQTEVVEYCKSKGIVPEAWGPLGAGKTQVMKNPVITALSEKYEKSPAQIILKWNIQRGVIVIPKSEHRKRQEENIDLFDFEITAEEMDTIKGIDKNLRLGSDPDHFDF